MLNEAGQEVPDSTPIVIHVRSRRISQFDEVRAFIRRELSMAARAASQETFEEANDFDIDGDPIDPNTPHEYSADQEAEDLDVLRSPPSFNAPPASTGSAPAGSPPAPEASPGSQPVAPPPTPQ